MTKFKLLSIVAFIVLAGCGQKGPLTVKPPEQTPALIDNTKTNADNKDSETTQPAKKDTEEDS